MLNIFANSFMTATRNNQPHHSACHTRFDKRRTAEIEKHLTGARRD